MKKEKEKNKDPQSRDWMLTIPASRYSEEELIKRLESKPNFSFVGQLEVGESSGFEHFQIFLQSSSPVRFSTLKALLPGCHIEKKLAHSSVENCIAYVTKTETRKEGHSPFSRGEIELKNSQGRRSDLELYHSRIVEDGLSADEVCLSYPKAWLYYRQLKNLESARVKQLYSKKQRPNIEVFYIFGDTGTGKTRFAFDCFPDAFRTGEYKNPWDNYSYQDTLILDEFAGQGQINFDVLLNLTDRYPLELSCRYANKFAAWDKVFIISNLALGELYPEIQISQPARWAAFERRINGGVFHAPEDLPKLYARFGEGSSQPGEMVA